MSRIAVCSNCKRETSIVAASLCGVCYTAVHKKFEKGTAEYDAALLKAKERCTGLEVDPAKRKGRPKKEVADKVPAKICSPNTTNTTVLALKAKRDELMDKVFKLNQAIEIIETL